MPANFPGPPEPRIHGAARLGDAAALQEQIAAGVDINLRADLAYDHGPYLRSLTPLMIAASSTEGASLQTVRWLVENGADVFARSEGDVSAAWYAAGGLEGFYFDRAGEQGDHDQRLHFLLDLGLDATEGNSIGRSLITESCQAGDARRVRLLLERGASPRRVVDTDEPHSFQFPLFCATESGCVECVRLILEAGEAVDVRDNVGHTPLAAATTPEIAKVLIEAGADIHAASEFDDVMNHILHACEDEESADARLDVARVLLDAGAEVEWRDEFDHTRLYSAAFRRVPRAVKFLLSVGADPMAPQGGSGTPLHGVCWQGESSDEENEATAKIIIELAAAGVDVDVQDDLGTTPLAEAAGGDWGNVTAIRTLVELGANPNLTDKHGLSPLMVAARGGETDCLKELLQSAADPAHVDNEGRTALSYAEEYVDVWRSINNEPPDIDIGMQEDPAQVAARHRDQLAKAEECVTLLRHAINS